MNVYFFFFFFFLSLFHKKVFPIFGHLSCLNFMLRLTWSYVIKPQPNDFSYSLVMWWFSLTDTTDFIEIQTEIFLDYPFLSLFNVLPGTTRYSLNSESLVQNYYMTYLPWFFTDLSESYVRIFRSHYSLFAYSIKSHSLSLRFHSRNVTYLSIFGTFTNVEVKNSKQNLSS